MKDFPSPPYAADTRSKGWRFELDLERVRQSDTWALAPAEVRPWLFMLWSEAWMQTPCGSLPQDDAITAARIGMPAKLFTKHKAVLLRGWWPAADGRLYHPVITEFVVGMLKRKDAERQRKAEYRAKMDAARAARPSPVPPLSHGTDTGLTGDSGGSDDTGTGTGTGEEDYGAKAPTSSAQGVSPAAAVCIALRKAGMAGVNPGHPRLLALIAAGATPAEFTALLPAAMKAAPGNPFAYLLASVEGERTRAAATAGQLHRGPLPNKQQALETRNRAVADEWAGAPTETT